MIKQALISVSDKTGIIEFARALQKRNIAILSTGGTAKLLNKEGIKVTEVAQYTGYPEMLDGRVKTLHPKIHGGILAKREDSQHRAAIKEAGIEPIDLIVVNLYPFRQTVAQSNVILEEAIENIDIGGPSMLRGAAKNYRDVTAITDPTDYAVVLKEMDEHGGATTLTTRFKLAQKVFSHTAFYDGAISNYLSSLEDDGKRGTFPATFNLQFEKLQQLRYGENPHQQAAFYRDVHPAAGALVHLTQLQGKELSYNNIADADGAWECVKTFDQAACVIVKHANPCGIAVAASILEAYIKAFATDPTSAFGGIIAFNRKVDKNTAEAVIKQFVEVVIAPEFSAEAKTVFSQKANIRLLSVPLAQQAHDYDLKRIGGGVLIQTPDNLNISLANLKPVTKVKPNDQQLSDLLFAWRVAKFVKSNAIVFCKNGQTLGVGAGQMSRVDSARIAAIKAENAKLSLAGSVVASDAFFPFRDGVDVVAKAGATAIIQPGGSMRDDEVIAAADELGIAMVFTGVRHFRH